MQALRYYRYGAPAVVQIEDVPPPVAGDADVLVKVHAASINSYDLHFVRGEPRFMRLMTGVRRPKNPRLGSDIAGTVAAVGRDVTGVAVGDRVFGGMSAADNSGFAEYVCGPARLFAPLPATIDFAQGAALPMAGTTALQAVRDYAQIKPGQAVLVYGSAGGVGTFVVQLAHLAGAHVTAVCSTRNVAQTLALGADRVIDYTRERFDADGQQYDIILAVNGYQPARAYRRALKPGGRYYMLGGQNRQIVEQLLTLALVGRLGGRSMQMMTAKDSRDDLLALAQLVATGQLRVVIDRSYAWAQAVEALAYVDAGHARGKVVVTLDAG